MHMSVHSRIWGMVGLFVFSLLLTGILYVASERQTLLAEKKLKTRQLVELAVSSARHYYQLGQSGRMSDSDAKAAALQSIRAMRYGGGEYFWIQDANTPVMIMHGTQPKLDGQRLDVPQMPFISAMQAGTEANGALQTDERRPALVTAANQLANTAGGGFITYDWPRMTANGPTEERYPKLSFVEKFEPWHWVIGTGIFIDDIDAAVKESALHHLGLLAVIGCILANVAAFLANSVVRPLRQATARLRAMSRDTAKLAPLPSERNDEIGALIAGYNQLQAALHKHEEELRLAASVFDNAQEGILITDAQANIIQVNPSFSRLTGYSAAEVIGRNPRLLASGKTPPETYREMWSALKQGQAWHGELINLRKDRSEFVQMESIAPVLGSDNKVSHFIGVIQDITEQKALARQLEEEAHRDYLTGLANRRYFIAQAALELARARRYNHPFSVAMLDLDHFKAVKFQASVFNQVGRIYAPRYRQAHIKSFYDSTENGKAALDFAYEDVKKAFEYYLRNYNNGRPIIIASHSQGSFHARRLLKDYFDTPEMKQKLVCAYVIGFGIYPEKYELLKPCNDALATNCYVTWSSFKKGYTPENVNMLFGKICVNPISWKTNNEKATSKSGILLNLNRKKLFKSEVQIKENYLWVKTNMLIVRKINVMHLADYNLYWYDIRKNVADRVTEYWKKK